MSADKTFYLENPTVLFSNIQIAPMLNMTLAEQLNAISRVIIIVFIVMLLLDVKYAVPFLVISLAFIIIIYYIQRKSMKPQNRENYVKGPNQPDRDISYVPCNSSLIMKCKGPDVQYYGIPVPENNPFHSKKPIPVGAPNDPPSSWNNELTRGGNIQFRKYGGPASWINDLDRGGNPTTGENRSFGEYGGNPLTKIKPVVIAPIYEFDYWKENNLIFPSQINRQSIQEDMYLSGYAESTCCDYLPSGTELVPRTCNDSPPSFENYSPNDTYPQKENYSGDDNYSQSGMDTSDRSSSSAQKRQTAPYCSGRGIRSPTVVQDMITVPSIREGFDYEDGADGKSSDMDSYVTDRTSSSGKKPQTAKYCSGRGIRAPTLVQDTITVPFIKEGYEALPNNIKIMPNHSGMVNTDCNYNPEQIFSSSLPSNYPSGYCEQDPALKKYNENLYTQIVTPGVYTKNQVNEPINSNIGISFQQQFEPTTMTRDAKGLHYLQHDPRVIDTTPQKEEYVDVKANYDNIYDPRFSGYGTSYRSYFEPVTGQTRFMYDDINAIKMPNYIVRSKIDHLSYADSYGPVEEGSEFGNVHNPHMRYLAQDSWMRDSINFRNDMTQLLMRKRNSEAWQQRQAPLGQRSLVRRGGV